MKAKEVHDRRMKNNRSDEGRLEIRKTGKEVKEVEWRKEIKEGHDGTVKTAKE